MIEIDGDSPQPEIVAPLGFVNYGHFTSFEATSNGVRGFALHLARLREDCQTLFGCDIPKMALSRALDRLQPLTVPIVVRITIYDPELELSHPGKRKTRPRVLLSTRGSSGPAGTMNPVRLRMVRYERELPEVKHVSLFGAIRERRLAQLSGFGDALFMDRQACISEGPTWNIGFFNGEDVIWPKANTLDGVTMRLLDESLPSVGLKSHRLAVTASSLSGMQCAFITNAALGFRPVGAIDDAPFESDHVLFRMLARAYANVPFEPVKVPRVNRIVR